MKHITLVEIVRDDDGEIANPPPAEKSVDDYSESFSRLELSGQLLIFDGRGYVFDQYRKLISRESGKYFIKSNTIISCGVRSVINDSHYAVLDLPKIK